MLSEKIKKLVNEYAELIKQTFSDDEPIVILYGSGVEGVETSDLDLCTIVHNYTEEDAKKVGEITKKFHIENGMKIDNEVPFENKVIYSFLDIEKVLMKPPFQIFRRKFYIPPIEKTEEYLKSKTIKYRLLLYVLTANSFVVYGNEKVLNKYRKRAWEILIQVMFSYIGNEFISKEEFLENLFKNQFTGVEGEDFLGYKREYKDLCEHLKGTISECFDEQTKKGKMLKSNGKYKCNPEWIKRTILIADSNNFEDINMNLKEYPKMEGYDFSENANPLGPSVKVQDALRECAGYINVYSDYKNIDINKDLSDFFKVSVDNVAIANGSLEAIYALPRFLDSSRATIIAPTYWGYAAGLDVLGRKYQKITLDKNLDYDLEKINIAAKKSTMMFICNPNNPTSSYIYKKDLYKIIKDNPNCHFIIDESHLLLHDNFFEETLSKDVEELKNLSIVYSLSKLFSVAGLRVGALISNKNVIQKYKNWQIPYSLNTMSQVIFPICLKDEEFVKNTRDNIHKMVKDLEEELRKFDWLEVKSSITNFIICKIKRGITAVELADKLEKDGIYIRELSNSYAEINGEWIRISVNRKEFNELLIRKLKSYNI